MVVGCDIVKQLRRKPYQDPLNVSQLSADALAVLVQQLAAERKGMCRRPDIARLAIP